MTTTLFNKNFRFTYQPNDTTAWNDRRRFSVGAGSLAKYVGEENAKNILKKAWGLKGDKKRMKFRVQGIIDVYVK